MKPFTQKISAAIITLALASTLSACQGSSSTAGLEEGSWDAVVEAASKEGSVSFYSGMAEIQNQRLVEAFNAEHPDITVRTQRGAGEMTARVESEMSTGTRGADVFVLADTNWFVDRPEDFLPLDGPATESWKPEGWITDETSIVVNTTPNSIFVWNTEIFPAGFETWDDLLAPEVSGKIGLRTDVTKSVAGYLEMMESELGEDYLVALGAQKPKVYSSVVPMTQAVASGEVGVTNASLPSTVYELKQNGAPIESSIPDPGYAMEFGMAVLKNASSPNAAAVFADFAMSPEGQAAVNGDGFGDSVGLDDVPGALDLEGFAMMDSSKYTPDALTEWDLKLERYYQK